MTQMEVTLSPLDQTVLAAFEDLAEGNLSPDEAIGKLTPQAIIGVLDGFAGVRSDDPQLDALHDQVVKAIDALPVVRRMRIDAEIVAEAAARGKSIAIMRDWFREGR